MKTAKQEFVIVEDGKVLFTTKASDAISAMRKFRSIMPNTWAHSNVMKLRVMAKND